MGSFLPPIPVNGIALVYGATGTFDISVLCYEVRGGHVRICVPGILLILVGMLFKISGSHFILGTGCIRWTSLVPITAYMATEEEDKLQ